MRALAAVVVDGAAGSAVYIGCRGCWGCFLVGWQPGVDDGELGGDFPSRMLNMDNFGTGFAIGERKVQTI